MILNRQPLALISTMKCLGCDVNINIFNTFMLKIVHAVSKTFDDTSFYSNYHYTYSGFFRMYEAV